MPTAVAATLLGVVQGLTEFLPISSTAHLLIVSRLIGFDDAGNVFTVMIQLGSILAVMWLYREKLLFLLRGLRTRPDARHFAMMIVVGSVPALAAGALLSGFVKQVLYASFGTIAVAFVVGGLVMLAVERYRPQPTILDVDQVSLVRAFGVGVCQMLALVPGVSRSGATIVGGLLMGLDRRAAAELSFFLAMPTIAAAFAHDLIEVKDHLAPERAGEIAIGFAMAFVAAALVVRPFLNFVNRRGFSSFAWYRIVVGAALAAALAAGWI